MMANFHRAIQQTHGTAEIHRVEFQADDIAGDAAAGGAIARGGLFIEHQRGAHQPMHAEINLGVRRRSGIDGQGDFDALHKDIQPSDFA